MRRVLIVALLVLLLASSSVAGGWRDLDGKAAPEISAVSWLHVPDGTASIERLEGKVWLLNFIGIH